MTLCFSLPFRPNPGFIEQLKLWGSMRCKIDPINKSYRAYRLQHMAKDMIGEKAMPLLIV
jgi:hypothetical protein